MTEYRDRNLLYNNNVKNSKWIAYIYKILNDAGLNNVWLFQAEGVKADWLKNSVARITKDQFLQTWNANVQESSKCLNYRIFKTVHNLENYLLVLPPKLRTTLCKFRCRNSKVPAEVGSHFNIPRDQRYCTKCDAHDLGDEYHYLFCCTQFNRERKLFISKRYFCNPSTRKMYQLLNSQGESLYKLSKFVCSVLKEL